MELQGQTSQIVLLNFIGQFSGILNKLLTFFRSCKIIHPLLKPTHLNTNYTPANESPHQTDEDILYFGEGGRQNIWSFGASGYKNKYVIHNLRTK